MSSYIVPDRNIATLVRHFIDRTYGWNRSTHVGREPAHLGPVPTWIATIISQNSGPHNDYDKAEQALFDALYRMNDRATAGRYSKAPATLAPEFPRSGRELPSDLAIVCGVMQNYTYQCSEEPVCKTEQFRQLEEYELNLRAALWDASEAGAKGRKAGWGEV
jgi:hypothetical protein